MNERFHLAVDMSSPAGSLALHRATDGALVAEADLPPGHSHSEAVLDRLDQLLRDAALSLPSVTTFVTSSGPGSFTGLRIAWATVKAFCAAFDRPLATLSGAEARAIAWASASNPSPGTRLLALSQVSSAELAQCELLVTDAGDLRYVGETTVPAASFAEIAPATTLLLDDRTVPPTNGARIERFPLRARHLVPALSRAATRRVFEMLAERSFAGPAYFGGSRFQ